MDLMKKIRTSMELRNNIIYGIKEEVYKRFDVPYIKVNGIPSPDYSKWEKNHFLIGEMEMVANMIYKLTVKNIKKVQNLELKDGSLVLEVREIRDDGTSYYREVYRY